MVKKVTKSVPKKKKAVNNKDRLFTFAYIANMIGRDFRKFPTLTAVDVAQELTNQFLKKWDRKQATHVEDLDEFLYLESVQARIKEVASHY